MENDGNMSSLENAATKEDITPKVGMEFDSENHAYLYYNMYAGYVGFSVRKDWRNKSKADGTTIISRKYCCYKAGFKREVECEGKKSRKELRVGCEAQMVISHVASGVNAHKAMGIKEKMGTSRVKGRPKSFIEKGSRKRRRPNAQPLVTNATINISTSLPGDYVQEAQKLVLQKLLLQKNVIAETAIAETCIAETVAKNFGSEELKLP
ncbi:zinc finger SWIM domain-containing protein 3 [Fagus crenata]